MFTYNSSTSSGWSINKVIPSERTPPMTTLTVVDSSLGLRRGVVQIDCLRDSTAVSMDVEQKFVTDGKCNGQSPTTATAATLYASTDDWIKKNTMKDIDYLGNLLYVSGTIGPDGNPTGRTNTLTGGTEKQDKIQAEFQASTPVPGPETANLCPSSDEWNAKYGGCVPRRMIAFADYRNGNLNFRYKDNTKPDIPGINSGGMIIFDPQNRRNGIYLTGATAIKYNPINILS